MNRDFLIWHFLLKCRKLFRSLKSLCFFHSFLPPNHVRIATFSPSSKYSHFRICTKMYANSSWQWGNTTQNNDWMSENWCLCFSFKKKLFIFTLGQATDIALLKISVSSQGSGEQINHQKLFDLSDSLPFPALSSLSFFHFTFHASCFSFGFPWWLN